MWLDLRCRTKAGVDTLSLFYFNFPNTSSLLSIPKVYHYIYINSGKNGVSNAKYGGGQN